MRVFLKHAATATPPTAIVSDMLTEELNAGMLEADTYLAFAERIRKIGVDLIAMLDQLKKDGVTVAGYGAPAKGNTLLNYFGIGPDRLDYLVDRNALKQGLYSPGMKIPIRSPDVLREDAPGVLLVLAWNFFDEIRAQQAEFAAHGGRFLVPLPYPAMVN